MLSIRASYSTFSGLLVSRALVASLNRWFTAAGLLLTVATAITSAACQSSSQLSVRTSVPSFPAPTSAVTPPSPPPAPSPTPGPVIRANGSLVFLRGKDLWVAALDGSSQRALTSGSLGAGYAGFTRSADGNVTLYYSSDTAPIGPAGYLQGGLFKVYREPLRGGAPEELFSFQGSGKNVEFSATNGAVSADGRYVAYSDERGLNLRDLERGTDLSLLTNVDCVKGSQTLGTSCFSYFDPAWSAAGNWLLTSKIFFEGAAPVTLQPLAQDVAAHDLGANFRYGGGIWSQTGPDLCLLPENYQGGAVVTAPDGTVHADLAEKLRTALHLVSTARISASWCGWGPNGEVAMAYGRDASGTVHVAVFDAALRLQHDIEVIVPASRVGALVSSLVSWLPDGSGFVVQHYPEGAAEPYDSVLLLDGSVRSLPFAAGRVLGSIP